MARRRWICRASAPAGTQGIGIGMGIRILPSCDALRTTAPRQWLAPSCSNPEYAGCRIRRGFRFRCSVLGCPGCAAGRARHLWRLSAVGTGFPFLGQGHRGAGTMPNRVRMRELLYVGCIRLSVVSNGEERGERVNFLYGHEINGSLLFF